MRKLLTYSLIVLLAFPWEAYAQTTTLSPTDPNHPAFASLKSTVQAQDSAGIDVPVISDPKVGTMTLQHQTWNALSTSTSQQSSGQLAPGCNPVVWAYMVQRAQKNVVREATLASGIHGQTAAAMNNKCTTKLGPNGEDRTDPEAKVRAQVETAFAALESAVCTLNFSGLLNGLVGGSVSICKNGKVFSSNLSSSLSSTFLMNGQDPFKSKDCAQPTALNSNLMKQVGGSYGQSALNGSSASNLGYSTSGVIPTGSGWTLGASLGGGNNGLGLTTTVGTTTTTTGTGASPVSSTGSGTPVPVTTSTPTTTSTATVTPAPVTQPIGSNTSSGAQNIYK